MTDATNSNTTCGTCRYWSEMAACSTGSGYIKALCIAPRGSPQFAQYTRQHQRCSAWASGHLGAIDAPSSDIHRYEREQK